MDRPQRVFRGGWRNRQPRIASTAIHICQFAGMLVAPVCPSSSCSAVTARVISGSDVKKTGQLVALLALLVGVLVPAMACALPGAVLSPAERACCVQMQGHCGSMNMPASHSCCHKRMPAARGSNAAFTPAAHFDLTAHAATALAAAVLLPRPETSQNSAVSYEWAVPHSPPSRTSILRI